MAKLLFIVVVTYVQRPKVIRKCCRFAVRVKDLFANVLDSIEFFHRCCSNVTLHRYTHRWWVPRGSQPENEVGAVTQMISNIRFFLGVPI